MTKTTGKPTPPPDLTFEEVVARPIATPPAKKKKTKHTKRSKKKPGPN
jgi:hypothetical protein